MRAPRVPRAKCLGRQDLSAFADHHAVEAEPRAQHPEHAAAVAVEQERFAIHHVVKNDVVRPDPVSTGLFGKLPNGKWVGAKLRTPRGFQRVPRKATIAATRTPDTFLSCAFIPVESDRDPLAGKHTFNSNCANSTHGAYRPMC